VWVLSSNIGECVDVKNKCEDLTNSTWCETKGAATSGTSMLDCFWLYSSSSTSDNNGKCKEKRDTSLTCSDVQRESQCTISGVSNLENGKCKWILSECHKVENSCESIRDSGVCGTSGAAGSKGCIWIEKETDGYRCEEVKETCNSIIRNNTCGVLGAAVGTNKERLECFWLYNSNSDEDYSGSCEDKTNTSLTCTQAKRSTQCTQSGITNFGDKCYWLEKNGSTPGKCINKV
jgi:hypothetical protein